MRPTINLTRPIPPLRLLSSYILSHLRLALAVIFASLYFLTIAWYYSLSSHDPSSYFFSSSHGYDKSYSLLREEQALAFINDTNSGSETSSTATSPPPTSPSMCIGVATVARPTTQYITLTIGSIFEGLTPDQRAQIHFVFFIAHTDPTAHPVYHEPWTRNLPDTQLTYMGLSTSQMSSLRNWESEHDYRSKGLFDYSYLLSACTTKTSAPYVAILEGDILAARGWYPRALAAAEHIDNLDTYDEDHPFYSPEHTPTGTLHPDLPQASWLYLRLFHTETYLGWNKEFWPTYLLTSFLIFFLLGTSLVVLRATFPYTLSRPLSNSTILLILFTFLPASIALFFALGRATVLPLSKAPPAGVQLMSNFGCCSQGFVFPRRIVPFIKKRIEERRVDYIDMMMEAAAGAWGLERWVVSPSLLQHVGGSSSKGDEIADERARMIWSFGFERWPEDGAGPP